MQINVLLFLVLWSMHGRAQHKQSPLLEIDNFILKKEEFKKNKPLLLVCRQEGVPTQTIWGTVLFTINGFKQEIVVKRGIAIFPYVIVRSTFVYLRHETKSGVVTKLYYLMKHKDNSITPIKISSAGIIMLPIFLLCLGWICRKLLFMVLLVIVLIFAFGSTKGLNLSTYWTSLLDGFKNLF